MDSQQANLSYLCVFYLVYKKNVLSLFITQLNIKEVVCRKFNINIFKVSIPDKEYTPFISFFSFYKIVTLNIFSINLWNSIKEKSTDKKKIDYDSTFNGISKFFEEDDD